MGTQIKLGGIVIDVVLKDIKHVHLSVYPPSGRVRISAPRRMSLDTLRPETDALIQEIMDQLRFNLRKKDDASQRRVMRSYGAKFTYASGETPDADDSTPDPKPIEPAVA